MKPLAVSLLLVTALAVTACAGTAAPAPTVTVTVTPEPAESSASDSLEGDEWQRFRDDPRQAFIFASAYELIMGVPIGNGETADIVVEVVHSFCRDVADGTSSWDELTRAITSDEIDAEAAEMYVALAQVYCPEVER